MTIVETRPHSTPALPPDLRLAAVRRRIFASGALAGAIADLAFGQHTRDHAETLNHTVRARVASYAESHS